MPLCLPVPDSKYSTLAGGSVAEMDSLPTALTWAASYIGCIAPLVSRPVIVLDIDGTILQNQADGSTKSVRYMTAFAQSCHNNGIKIFIVTARPDFSANRSWTERQLEACGIYNFEALLMRPNKDPRIGTNKYIARESIRSKGHNILLSIGDQWADLNNVDAPENMSESAFYVGTIGDDSSFAIKLPSEFR